MPNPRHKPTDKTKAEVQALSSYGVTIKEIASYIGIDQKTLQKYYQDILDTAYIRANAAVARVLFEKATIERETASVIFWLKTRAKWRETQRHEVTGENGKPVEIKAEYEDIDVIMKDRFKKILNQDSKGERRSKSK